MRRFDGYRRIDGRMGIRNHVIVINTVGSLISITKKLAKSVPGVIPVVHQTGEEQFPEDLKQTIHTLKGTITNPNVHSALFIGKSEDEPAFELSQFLKNEGYRVQYLAIQTSTSLAAMLDEGKEWLQRSLELSSIQQKESADITELIVGLECGGSDAWSGITANPAIGSFSETFVDDGGTSILSETTEAIGAEHILAEQAINQEVKEQFLNKVHVYEQRIKAVGDDIRLANPTPGNIVGGLTTLEEKSLGCIKKGGNSPLMEVLDYAHRPQKKGFVFMDTPGFDVESVSGLAAGGVGVILFSTGKGSPTGSPIVPVIKISTNSNMFQQMSEHIDLDAGTILEGKMTIEEVGEQIYEEIENVANGKLTKSENNRHHEFSIWRLAETI